MRIFKFLFPVVLALSLSACSGTWEGMKADVEKKPLSSLSDNVPQGYANGRVLKPIVQETQLAPPASAEGPRQAWNDVGDYRQWLTAGTAAPQSVAARYNSAVTVYSLDGAGGDVAAYNTPGWMPAGSPAQTLYFAHGSAQVKKADKAKLRKLARNTKKNKGNGDSFTVVGHASHRVDRVKDPVKRKMINLAMAQKRANAVTHELKKAGLKPAWVKAVSKGDDEPNTAPPPGMSQEAADRRVDVYTDGK